MKNSSAPAIVIVFVIVANVIIGGLSVQYLAEFWGTFITHKEVIIPFLPCGVVGLFVAEIALPLALITWIISFAI